MNRFPKPVRPEPVEGLLFFSDAGKEVQPFDKLRASGAWGDTT